MIRKNRYGLGVELLSQLFPKPYVKIERFKIVHRLYAQQPCHGREQEANRFRAVAVSAKPRFVRQVADGLFGYHVGGALRVVRQQLRNSSTAA
jgi:hypothetical protein